MLDPVQDPVIGRSQCSHVCKWSDEERIKHGAELEASSLNAQLAQELVSKLREFKKFLWSNRCCRTDTGEGVKAMWEDAAVLLSTFPRFRSDHIRPDGPVSFSCFCLTDTKRWLFARCNLPTAWGAGLQKLYIPIGVTDRSCNTIGLEMDSTFLALRIWPGRIIESLTGDDTGNRCLIGKCLFLWQPVSGESHLHLLKIKEIAS